MQLQQMRAGPPAFYSWVPTFSSFNVILTC
jgi:hypothetical protein